MYLIPDKAVQTLAGEAFHQVILVLPYALNEVWRDPDERVPLG